MNVQTAFFRTRRYQRHTPPLKYGPNRAVNLTEDRTP